MADALRPVWEMWGGRHLDSTYTRRIPFKKLRLEADTDFAVQTDGEPRGDTKVAEFSRDGNQVSAHRITQNFVFHIAAKCTREAGDHGIGQRSQHAIGGASYCVLFVNQ